MCAHSLCSACARSLCSTIPVLSHCNNQCFSAGTVYESVWEYAVDSRRRSMLRLLLGMSRYYANHEYFKLRKFNWKANESAVHFEIDFKSCWAPQPLLHFCFPLALSDCMKNAQNMSNKSNADNTCSAGSGGPHVSPGDSGSSTSALAVVAVLAMPETIIKIIITESSLSLRSPLCSNVSECFECFECLEWVASGVTPTARPAHCLSDGLTDDKHVINSD